MAGVSPQKSAAHLVGTWQEELGYDPDGPFLLLSGGDMWTGPAISTWFQGASQAEVMTAMGYRAAAVGNHEFDFGLDLLAERAQNSTFPLVAANIRYRDSGADLSALGIEPYTMVTVNGVTAGIIGLSTTATPFSTKPENVRDFEFIDYETALREVVPQLKAEGAELILVPAHICEDEIVQLAREVADLDIDLIGAGHCNEYFAKESGQTVLVGGGSHMASYAFATFELTGDQIFLSNFGTGKK